MRLNPILKSASDLSSAEYAADRVKDAYKALNIDGVGVLESLYTEDVHFEDPVNALQGRSTLMAYFDSIFKNLQSCSFKFHQSVISDADIFMSWTMFISHPKLRNVETIRVDGGSLLKTRHGRIFYQRDYFDMGAMLYEQLSLLGLITRKIRQKLGQRKIRSPNRLICL